MSLFVAQTQLIGGHGFDRGAELQFLDPYGEAVIEARAVTAHACVARYSDREEYWRVERLERVVLLACGYAAAFARPDLSPSRIDGADTALLRCLARIRDRKGMLWAEWVGDPDWFLKDAVDFAWASVFGDGYSDTSIENVEHEVIVPADPCPSLDQMDGYSLQQLRGAFGAGYHKGKEDAAAGRLR